MKAFVDPRELEKLEKSNEVLPNRDSTLEDFIITNSWFF